MVFVLGLDGATFDLLDAWLEEGYLPTLAALITDGVRAPLASTLPPVTAPAWATFMTGKHPEQHGVFDFFRHVGGGRVELVNGEHIQSRLFWEYLADTGLQAGILNVPVTHPPRPLPGFIIPGLLSPDQARTTFPPQAWQQYEAKLGPYRLTPDLLYQPGNERAFLQELHAVTTTQFAYAQHLLRDHPLDFCMLHILGTDIVQHKFWRYMDPAHPWYDQETGALFGTAIRNLFCLVDAELARLLEQLPGDTTTFIMSDHGFGPQYGTVNLNLALLDAGLLRLHKRPEVRVRRAVWSQPLLCRLGSRLLHRERLLEFADVDWQRTHAFSLGHMGQIYVNLEDREPQGRVPLSRYSDIQQAVVQLLKELRHPETGAEFVDRIVRCEKPGSGPDIQVVMDGYRLTAYPLFAADGRLVTEQQLVDSGSHRSNGILIGHGPGVAAGAKVTAARLVDLAPTILHLLGMPVPDDMDGRVLTEMLAQPEPPSYQPGRPRTSTVGDAVSASEQKEIADRLRALGYLEGSA